jgi:hypothetical protein
MLGSFVSWLESHSQKCFYKHLFGIECPGCGMQRAFIALLKGDVAGSIMLFPALLPMLFMFGYLIAHLLFKFKHGAAVLKYLFIANTGIIVINYIFKFINH